VGFSAHGRSVAGSARLARRQLFESALRDRNHALVRRRTCSSDDGGLAGKPNPTRFLAPVSRRRSEGPRRAGSRGGLDVALAKRNPGLRTRGWATSESIVENLRQIAASTRRRDRAGSWRAPHYPQQRLQFQVERSGLVPPIQKESEALRGWPFQFRFERSTPAIGRLECIVMSRDSVLEQSWRAERPLPELTLWWTPGRWEPTGRSADTLRWWRLPPRRSARSLPVMTVSTGGDCEVRWVTDWSSAITLGVTSGRARTVKFSWSRAVSPAGGKSRSARARTRGVWNRIKGHLFEQGLRSFDSSSARTGGIHPACEVNSEQSRMQPSEVSPHAPLSRFSPRVYRHGS
jgi:hypothetical protein